MASIVTIRNRGTQKLVQALNHEQESFEEIRVNCGFCRYGVEKIRQGTFGCAAEAAYNVRDTSGRGTRQGCVLNGLPFGR